jgi:hypothetical protein
MNWPRERAVRRDVTHAQKAHSIFPNSAKICAYLPGKHFQERSAVSSSSQSVLDTPLLLGLRSDTKMCRGKPASQVRVRRSHGNASTHSKSFPRS